MKNSLLLACLLVCFFIALDSTDAWRGGCSMWSYYWSSYYYYDYRCSPGWTHNGDYNCNIPVCRPRCRNGGTCQSPNHCKCPTWSTGYGCASLTCSYQRPCYPGDCKDSTDCTCESGFIKESNSHGCTIFNSTHDELRPVVGKSNVTLAHIRRTDNSTDFMFVLEGLKEKEPGKLQTIWSNQKRFNNLRFEYESHFTPPENLPERPNYVHDSKVGIVESVIEANVSKVSRTGSPIRDEGSFKRYLCESGFTKDNPARELATCIIDDDQFKTLIEHGDWLNVKLKTFSGGFQKLVNTDQRGIPYATRYYKGLEDGREVQFNFDFIAPKHCSEENANDKCGTMLKIDKEFTKEPISLYWSGWTDDLSGLMEYYVEVFKLSPDPYDRLVEMEPLSPVYSTTVNHSDSIDYPSHTPNEPGMYSVLMETRDLANNSRIVRRLVLFDDTSEISLSSNNESKLYISSAVEETGYMWQTAVEGQSVRLDVAWTGHFINYVAEENMLLNEVDNYPIQFKEIADDGILSSKKFVEDRLDDHEGERTRDAIDNYHGIVKFEAAKVLTLDDEVPTTGWRTVSPFEEKTSFTEKLSDGSRVRIWVRATDSLGNTKTDSTLVTVDGTPPKISRPGTFGTEHKFVPNIGPSVNFNYTSKIVFTASDAESGVHKIGYTIKVKTDNKNERVIYQGFAPASMDDNDNPLCDIIEGKCFIPQQSLELDNCWFMISKSDLETSTASVTVSPYNQALLNTSTSFEVGPVKHLQGLEEYNGPENMRIESQFANGFRVAWDLPEKSSCYGRAEIVIVLLKKEGKNDIKLETYYAQKTSTYYDILGLSPETDYKVDLGMRLPNALEVQDAGVSLDVKTTKEEKEGSNAGGIAGAVIGTLAVVAVLITILFFLDRKGYIQTRTRVQTIRRAVTQRVTSSNSGAAKSLRDHRMSDLYIYGEMDTSQMWKIQRNDVVFEELIKSGHFANIYKAKLKAGKGPRETVVAKTLKEGFTRDDELLMKAKINFTGEKVGDHPNVLKFIGAVVNDDAMGPFIIYEYCEHGPLRDYLADHKNNVTMDLVENLFRFGLDIARGMEFLAEKGIVHRRLAARNILLTFLKEVKISGFGPQPVEEGTEDAERAKKERIPIKWVAPECMESTRDATEQSDVWSYAVVLWEIFSLGETPYTGKGTDLKRRLKKGERLAKPEQCDETWYKVMLKCWSYKAKERPTFSEIRGELDNMFEASPGDDFYFYKR